MNTEYLDTLPEKQNIFGVKLDPGEKPVFTPNLSMAGNEKGSLIGAVCKITLTNRKLVIDNGLGIWTVPVEEFATNFERVVKGRFFKEDYFLVMIEEPVLYGSGRGEEAWGFRMYLKGDDAAWLEEIAAGMESFA